MSKEELYKALKIFNREDLTYENDERFNDFEEYMSTMKQEKAIEVFMSTKDMIKYSKLEQEIERLNELVKGLREERDYLFNKTTTESNYEIERINNIINELEKYLDEALGQDMYRYDFKIILDKLQELKGDDK